MFDNLTRRELIAMAAHQKEAIENLHKLLAKQENKLIERIPLNPYSEKNEISEDAEIDFTGTIVETKSGEEFKAFVDSLPEDTGTHYRFSYTVPIAPADLARGTITINLDPFRIAAIYGMQSFAAQTILKKVLCTGSRGHNSTKEDIDDIICACRRWLQMLEEDALLEQRISPPQKDQSQP